MARFDTTNWSVVLKASSGDTTGCREALATLCETYWYPVYAFVRRSGASASDAEERAQLRVLGVEAHCSSATQQGTFATRSHPTSTSARAGRPRSCGFSPCASRTRTASRHRSCDASES